MAVYVDNAKNRLGRLKMAHMLADSLDELHAMADRVGLRREWFQGEGTPHYDLCQARRKLAVQAGAIELDRRGVVAVIRRLRSQGKLERESES